MTSTPQTSNSAEITRRAKSNLAFAFLCVPRDRLPDLNTFYAFCRVIDDIATWGWPACPWSGRTQR